MNKTPAVVTIVLLAAVAAVGWHNHRRLAALRAEHHELVSRAGVTVDPSRPGALREARRQRRDPDDEARQLAARHIAREAATSTGRSTPDDPDARRRSIEAAEALASMNSRQLQTYIREILAAAELDERTRARLFDSAIRCLVEDHPRDALELILGSDGILDLVKVSYYGPASNTVFAATRRLAELDPSAAFAWLGEQRDRIPESYRDTVAGAVALASGRSHATAVVALCRELGCKPSDVADALVRDAQSTDQRLAVLAVLTGWRDAGGDGQPGILAGWQAREFVFGGSFNPLVEDDAFGFSTGWIESVDLSAEEVETLTSDLPQRIALADTGRWVDWLDRNLPPEPARERIDGLVENWTRRDVRAAADWLAGLPDGPVKSAAVTAHAVALLPHDPGTAVAWALGLPEGQPRTEALRRLHRSWPGETAADRAAAASFAAEHGID